MLNTFPELLTYSTFGPLILRFIIGFIFLDLGLLKFKGEKATWIKTFNAFKIKPAEMWVSIYGLVQVIGGLFLIAGAYTQIAALVFAIFTAIEAYIEWKEGALLKRNFTFYVLMLAISVSLLLTGAGAYAVDLPL